MKPYLLFLSLLMGILSGHAETAEEYSGGPAVERYAFRLDSGKAGISGILALSQREDVIIGSLVNEFGISAADFIYYKNKGKLKLLNVVSFLNKWYIKRVLSSDLKYMLESLYGIPHKMRKHYVETPLADGLRLVNTKRKLTYEINKIEQEPEETDINETL